MISIDSVLVATKLVVVAYPAADPSLAVVAYPAVVPSLVAVAYPAAVPSLVVVAYSAVVRGLVVAALPIEAVEVHLRQVWRRSSDRIWFRG